jgi:hypothetical protein
VRLLRLDVHGAAARVGPRADHVLKVLRRQSQVRAAERCHV